MAVFERGFKPNMEVNCCYIAKQYLVFVKDLGGGGPMTEGWFSGFPHQEFHCEVVKGVDGCELKHLINHCIVESINAARTSFVTVIPV